MAIIDVRNVSKIYPARRGVRAMLGRGGIGALLRRRKTATFKALEAITLQVEPGEVLGIIGRNGSGKSTLLKILAGVTLPSEGEVAIGGRVASLLELGAGFHPMLTGRENVFLNAGLMGMRHAQVRQYFDHIVDFSGIAEFIDQPVETYSSGMYVRIAFAVAVYTNPDIFLVDEVLSVGDEEFQRKCQQRIGELRDQGKTIVFVSHDLGIVNTLCERVILLDKGRIINRGTAQKTMNYYLRLVGQEGGVHAFSAGDSECVQSEGRLFLFHNGEEITSAKGCNVRIESYRQWHDSQYQVWRIPEKDERGCRSYSQLTRLPIRLHWDLSIEGDRFRWRVSMECLNAIEISQIELNIFMKTAFSHWLYADFSGEFPDILPSDNTWHVLVAPEKSATEAAVLPPENSQLPPLFFQLETNNPFFYCMLANTEYMTFSRVLQVLARFPEGENTFEKGHYDLFALDIVPLRDAAAARERIRAERTLTSGPLAARFEQGMLRLSADGEELTAFFHGYTSMLIEHLWNNSQTLQWSGREDLPGGGVRFTGESRRFPYRQEWELVPVEDGFDWRIWLEVFEPMNVIEYHASLLLSTQYTRWASDQESGAFPEMDRNVKKWVHLNRSYAPGRRITALSSALPSVTLEADAADIPFRMTAINTMYDENARVLQALRPSGAGQLHFQKGRHLYFSGSIRVAADPADHAAAPDGPEKE
jgi:ABC-type polysaccharide/polyol phosphate transport system ATPase subunit